MMVLLGNIGTLGPPESGHARAPTVRLLTETREREVRVRFRFSRGRAAG